MTPKEFAAHLHLAVVEENTAIYRDLFLKTPIEKASDQYWKRALALFNQLSPSQRDIFFEVVRQVSVDTTSNVLGVIDGANALEGVDAGFELMCGNQQLNGDLQSLFLVEEEHIASHLGSRES